jgi:glycosyltransferase involved in cell wall biosynthesis
VSDQPAITFAIPFYRGVDHLERAVRSVVNQTIGEWRLLVVDDGGTDGAGAQALVDRLDDGRASYRRFENAGLAGNWNRCLDLATTDLVTILHGDDELLPHYGDVVVAAHERHRDATAVWCRVAIVDDAGRPVFSLPDAYKRVLAPRRRASDSGDALLRGDGGLASLLRGNHVFCPTLCYRRSALGTVRFDDRWRFVLDLALMAEVLLAGGSLVGVRDVAYRYRRHNESQTALLTATSERFVEEAAIHRPLASPRASAPMASARRCAHCDASVSTPPARRAADGSPLPRRSARSSR